MKYHRATKASNRSVVGNANLGQQGEKKLPRKIYARKPFLRANQVHFLASTEDLSPFEASVSREILFLAAAAFIGLWQLRAELVSKVFDKTRLCGIARRFFVDWLLRCFVTSAAHLWSKLSLKVLYIEFDFDVSFST